ncbi:MAG: carbohydrate binding family 9 domain-containing protein [Bernardetiaceae bacterium]|nr:carbohydrate binding family 9 domain-containing protein [Bernardetiaceae bacterium]
MFFCLTGLAAQGTDESTTPPSALQYRIQRAAQKVKLDGVLDDPAWQNAQRVSDFNQHFPFDSSRAVRRTEVMMTYDEEFIYVAGICYDGLPGSYIISSLRRDYRGPNYDGFNVVIDPFQDKTNAFFFGLSPYKVQREGLIANGGAGQGDLSLSWDNKWYGETKIEDDRWVAEIAIPFKTLRFKDGTPNWNVNFYRIDSKQNERSAWSDPPRNFQIYNLAYIGELVWDVPLKKTGPNISLIPFATAGLSRQHQNGEPGQGTWSVGGDAKVAVTPGLNLDLTVNPDFSQVEVDRQVTNLDRFEIFFPERRQFFLENADLFADFGANRLRPFFSRRIGVAIDQSTGQNVQNPIYFGARLSGKLDQNWRLGLLNMQAGRDAAINLPSYNFTVAAVQRRVFSRSNLGAIFVNREAFGNLGDSPVAPERFNRMFGLDYNLASATNTWTGKVFYHRSFTQQPASEPFAHGVNLVYNKPKLRLEWNHQLVGRDYNAAVGFVPRRDYRRANPQAAYFLFPKSKTFNRVGFYATADVFWNQTNGLTDRNISIGNTIRFQNTAEFEMFVAQDYTYLFAAFDPTRTGGTPLAQGTAYTYRSFNLSFASNNRHPFYFNLLHYWGEFFNGRRLSFQGDVNVRFRPYGVFSVDFTYNRLRFPAPQNSADLWLLGPRVDLTFSRSLFLTAFVQYNSQINNLNINTRLQWRFKPVSDIFLVYTDNYFPDTFRQLFPRHVCGQKPGSGVQNYLLVECVRLMIA